MKSYEASLGAAKVAQAAECKQLNNSRNLGGRSSDVVQFGVKRNDSFADSAPGSQTAQPR